MRAPFGRPQHRRWAGNRCPGSAFIWRFVLHARPGERFDLWFGILVAQLMVTLCFAVMGAVFAWRQTPSGPGSCKELPAWSF